MGPIYKLLKSHVNYALMWILRILGTIKFYKGPIKISNDPLIFGNVHVFEWDMGHWPILWAHHYFGLGLSLAAQNQIGKNFQQCEYCLIHQF